MPHDMTMIAAIIWTSITLWALLGALQFVMLPTFVEEFRQDLFEIRRSLFLLVAMRRVDPTAPAYANLRRMINGLLRFAERITLTRLLLASANHEKWGGAYRERTAEQLANIADPEVRSELKKHKDRVGLALVQHTIKMTPLLWPIIVLASALFLVWHQGRILARVWITASDKLAGIEAEAECLGDGTATA